MSAAALINCYGLYGQNRSEIELESSSSYFKQITSMLQPSVVNCKVVVIVQSYLARLRPKVYTG
jgi:hypothetical protein